ncbi:tail fiber domain-containing protein [Pantoea piersonii]|uniref:tail fiber domain-containing protein n=1 Tax=Pantoea piersonii TaxID=2364647 RepID=UPI0022F18926|nr:tail fiber domain-containing protein [Pantoea piersonii]WBV23048.1 tail fiber domain-containing protein [Pantoea piersonii]
MPAGTITLTSNSTAVTGSGTSFTSELKANDFIVAIVGGITYTLGVKSVDSATGVTLITAYGGPTTSGLAWTPVPNAALVGITAQVAADVAKAIRGLNMDKANWQQVFSGTGTITVTLPDGSQYSGPAWNNIATTLSGKLDKNQNLNDLPNKATAVSNLGLGWLVNDGGGNYQIGNTGNNLKIFANGGTELRNTGGAVGAAPTTSDPLWTSLAAGSLNAYSWYSSSASGLKYGGALTSNLVISGSSTRRVTLQHYLNPGVDENALLTVLVGGTATNYLFNNGGYATAPKGWTTASDERIKKDIAAIDDPLGKMKLIKGCTWTRVDIEGTGIGFIAQDVQKAFPDSVINLGNRQLPDGTLVKDLLAPDTTGVAAALHHEAILALMDKIEKQDAIIAELQSRMSAVDGLDA